MRTKTWLYVLIVALVLVLNLHLVHAKYYEGRRVEADTAVVKGIVPDSVITAEIITQYVNDIDTKLLNVQVETVNGIVTITGTAANAEVKEKIINIARNTYGVKEVIALIDIM